MTEATTADPVTVSVDDGVATVTLNRPAARNAVNLDLCLALRAVFEDIDSDDTVRVVLIVGAGSSFCAGADLKERVGRDSTWVRRRRIASFAAYEAIERCSKPVVALVHGAVIGSGGEITMAADFALAAAGTSFRFPEAHWGTVGATQRLQRAIGKRRAKELLFTNRALSAEEANQLGLVVAVVPSTELLSAGMAMAATIAKAPPDAMALTKRAVDLGEETTLGMGIRIEMAAIEQNLAAGGWRAGVARFADGESALDDGTTTANPSERSA
ncbi:enoyl-CoA hydratase/isomerase family protein [Mycolicibacterium sp. CBM1]